MECVEKDFNASKKGPRFGEEIRVSKCWNISKAGDSTWLRCHPSL
jgi:hypothetical protein